MNIFAFVCSCVVVATRANNWLERFTPKMTCNVLMGILHPTHSLTRWRVDIKTGSPLYPHRTLWRYTNIVLLLLLLLISGWGSLLPWICPILKWNKWRDSIVVCGITTTSYKKYSVHSVDSIQHWASDVSFVLVRSWCWCISVRNGSNKCFWYECCALWYNAWKCSQHGSCVSWWNNTTYSWQAQTKPVLACQFSTFWLICRKLFLIIVLVSVFNWRLNTVQCNTCNTISLRKSKKRACLQQSKYSDKTASRTV